MKVAFAITSFEGVPFDVYQNHIQCICDWTKKYKLFLATVSDTTLVTAREMCINVARKHDSEYILYVDSDVLLPLDALDKLISCDVDLASGLCVRRGWPFTDIAWVKIDGKLYDARFDPKIPGIYPVEWVGGGCALFKMSVFDKLDAPYFRHVFENGKQVYEDIHLCMRMQEKGMSIVIDSRVQCGHKCRGMTVYPENADVFKEMFKKIETPIV